MQTAKHLLFVTNGPQQQVNALILARKLALVATQHGYKHSVISLDEFESSDHFDHVIIKFLHRFDTQVFLHLVVTLQLP
ncbi:hypothetical protein B4Q10_13065 [Acinetobacter baumannii]|nr:hypothetical protein B4Q10_13065 [Acinetobacter baumannii]